MGNGYTGKILKLDLTHKSYEVIPTSKYSQWVGGHGMGSAIFWDLCEDKTVLGTDPKNVITLMTSPLSGTIAPSVSGRTEVQGIGLQGYPVGWFTRSNFGGRFSAMLKFAGWDGIAVVGKADSKVWVNIVNGTVTFEDAADLWGLDTGRRRRRSGRPSPRRARRATGARSRTAAMAAAARSARPS